MDTHATESTVMEQFKEYMRLKTRYFATTEPEVYRVFDVKTNCPLRFREEDGAYIVEVVHPSCPGVVYYRYTIRANDYIDLTHLYEQHRATLESMHVDEDRLYYLRKIEQYNQRKTKLHALQNIPLKNPAEPVIGIPSELYKEEMTQLDADIQTLRDEFDAWMDKVKRLVTEMDLIREIAEEIRQEKRDALNSAQINYFHLWNQQQIQGHPGQRATVDASDMYRVKQLLYQTSGTRAITKGMVVEYNKQWYVALSGNEGDASVPIRIIPLHSMSSGTETGTEREKTISVLASEVVHHEGYYHQWKQFKLPERVRVTRERWHNRLAMCGFDDIDGRGTSAEEIIAEYPATPDRRPRQIMMDSIKGNCSLDDAGADVDEKKETKKTTKKTTKKDSKKDSKDDTDVKKKKSKKNKDADKETEGGSNHRRLSIKVPTKRDLRKSPPRHSPRHMVPRKSSLKHRDGKDTDASMTPKESSEVKLQLYRVYLEKLYNYRNEIPQVLTNEHIDKLELLKDYPNDSVESIFSDFPEINSDGTTDVEADPDIVVIEDKELIEGILLDFDQLLRTVFPEFLENVVMENGKRRRVLDTVSLYNMLIHDDIQYEYSSDSDEDSGDSDDSDCEDCNVEPASMEK